MKQIIFRDDDTSYFTRPDQLEAIYGRIWEAGCPVCLAIVPAQYGDVRVYWRDGNPYDPAVPPQYRGTEAHFPITDNVELCEYVREKAEKGLIEICLHGYSHTFFEFTSQDRNLINSKIDMGLEILSEAFPNNPVRTFVAPYDRMSPTALECIMEWGLGFCTMSWNIAPLLELQQIKGFARAPLTDSLDFYTCDEYYWTHRDDPKTSLQKAKEHFSANPLYIAANHYWMYSYDWESTPNADAIAMWNQFLDVILADKSVQIVPFHKRV